MEKKYFRSLRNLGRTPKLEFKSEKEIRSLSYIDEALWTATCANIDYINCDKVFLRYLDRDRDGLILCHEVKSAVKWLDNVLSDWEGIVRGSEILEK